MSRMKTYDSLTHLMDDVPKGTIGEIANALIKAWPKIHGWQDFRGENRTSYPVIMVSISGGSDSDIMLDMIERIGHPNSEVHYVFFDTGIEYEATKEHLSFLEEKYGITIERYPAKLPVPLGVKKYGLPFLSKRVSQYISRLQSHGFKWEDEPFDELLKKYPKCKAALRWWCNEWGKGSRMNINYNRFLKEFMISNPPNFRISDGCCNGAKKYTAKYVEKQISPDLVCQGVRKAEGGARATAIQSCFSEGCGQADVFRPIFWFKNVDKAIYTRVFGIVHSRCYSKYGLCRTGCAGCPFGKRFEEELEIVKQWEPRLYKALINIFGQSYEYTRRYREFYKERKHERYRNLSLPGGPGEDRQADPPDRRDRRCDGAARNGRED